MNELLMKQSSPHVRRTGSVAGMMFDVIVALLPIYIMAFYYNGIRAIWLGLAGVVSAVGFSALSALLSRRPLDLSDFTPVITGLIIPILMPADIPYYVIAVAEFVAIMVVKFPFGGTGENLFNPSAVGFAAVALCWPSLVFSYPGGTSPAYSLTIGAVPDYDILEMLLGKVPGPMGASCILVILASGLFLAIKKDINWRTPVFFLLSFGILSLIFRRITATALESALYELCSGMIVFGGVFMMSEPVTSPKNAYAVSVYSFIGGVVAYLFRRFGGFEDGFIFALILLNVIAPLFDDIFEAALHLSRNGRMNFRNLRAELGKNGFVRGKNGGGLDG